MLAQIEHSLARPSREAAERALACARGLDANDYAQDPASEPILQEYLDEGFLFAAVKLTAGADVDQIHPLAFRFQGTEPCVPIRLTRIAAEDANRRVLAVLAHLNGVSERTQTSGWKAS